MPNATKQPTPVWCLPDLVDFESYLTSNDRDLTAPAEPELRPTIDAALQSTQPLAAQRRGLFRHWLDARRGNLVTQSLPGTILLENSLRNLTFILTVLSFVSGAALVLALLLLERTNWAFNVQLFFGATVLLQLALLAILTASWFFRRALFGSQSLSTLHEIIHKGLAHSLKKIDRTGAASSAFQNFANSHGNILRGLLLRTSQFVGIAFNFGLLAAFFGCLLVLDISFYWESTFGSAMDGILYRITQLVSLPWSWIRPEWTPALDAIQVRGTADGTIGRITATDAAQWYPFLLCSIVTWGLLPRVLLHLGARFSLHRALCNLSFSQRRHRDLWRHLTSVDIHPTTTEPSDGAIVLNWNDIKITPEELHDRVIRSLRLNPVEILTIGISTPEADDAVLHGISQHHRDSHQHRDATAAIVILAESWGLVPKRMRDFHAKIRAHLSRDLPLHFLLVGAPTPETSFTPPAKEDLQVWENFLDTLNDPNTDIRAYHAP